MKEKKKLLVILGPTASGKSDLAVECALNFNGEVVSADSRQVYEGLDIATGKITQEEMRGIPHHLLDVARPQEQYSVALYKEAADEVIEDVHARGKLPILAGGTGFYIQAIVDNMMLPDVGPNQMLREQLQEKSVEELRSILKELDPRREEDITQDNPRRLIRAIEIAKELGHVPKVQKEVRFNTLQIGLKPKKKELKRRIQIRTQQRLERGMIEEVEELYKEGLSLKRMRELGLEYEHLADYLEDKIDTEELVQSIERDDWRYARQQIKWFKRDKRIKWFSPENPEEILAHIKEWLTES
ncbi:MAG: tRNA (adenosine(37)-N6)-dimethylallyltransferase MiaA [Candidatus Paceibacterota bacterium]